jgi:hypothetical protein
MDPILIQAFIGNIDHRAISKFANGNESRAAVLSRSSLRAIGLTRAVLLLISRGASLFYGKKASHVQVQPANPASYNGLPGARNGILGVGGETCRIEA